MRELRDDETTAILHHNLRGSGREVVIFLGDAGIEITNMVGDEIAIWPYPAISFANAWDGSEQAAFQLPHDDILVLHVHSGDWVERIVALSPELRAARRDTRTAQLLNFWGYLPDPAQAGILIALIVGFIWGASRIYGLFFG